MQVAGAEWRPLWSPTKYLEPVPGMFPHWLTVQSCPTVPRNLRPTISVDRVRRFADLGAGPTRGLDSIRGREFWSKCRGEHLLTTKVIR